MKEPRTKMNHIFSILSKIIFFIFIIIITLILTAALNIIITSILEKMFLPKEYIMWVYKSPFSMLFLIFEVYIMIGLSYAFRKYFKIFIFEVINFKGSFIKRHSKVFIISFIIFNILIIYTMLYNVAVITDDSITNYTFLSPEGNTYKYDDIAKIETGIYGEKFYLPFTHSKGEFYYIIGLNDGTNIDLNEIVSFKEDEDPRFIIAELDKKYVNMGIPKESSMDNFEYITEHLDKIYTDKIRDILMNTK